MCQNLLASCVEFKNAMIITRNWVRLRKRGAIFMTLLIAINCYILMKIPYFTDKEIAFYASGKHSFSKIIPSSDERYLKALPKFSKNYVEEVVKRFEGRNRRIRKKCKSLMKDVKGYSSFNPNIKNRMKFCRKHDLLVCQNNQNGVTTLTHIVDIINSASNASRNNQLPVRVKHVKSKILVVGNPLEGLVHSFKHMFGHGVFQQHKSRSVNHMENEPSLQSLNHTEKLRISFSRFLEFVLNKNKSKVQFMTTAEFCSPCFINYKYILRKNTFVEDLFSLLNLLNITEISRRDLESTLEEQEVHKTDDYLDYYSGLEGSLLKRVFLYAREDLYLFEYEIPELFLKHLEYTNLI